MATREVSIFQNLNPKSDDIFWEPYSVKATNDKWDPGVWIFNDSGNKDALHGSCQIPSDYVGSPVIIPIWTAIVTTGNVVFDLDIRSVGGNDTTSLDQSTAAESETVTDAAPSAVNERLQALMSPTASNLTANYTLEWILYRDGADASDTMSGAVILFDLILRYADA